MLITQPAVILLAITRAFAVDTSADPNANCWVAVVAAETGNQKGDSVESVAKYHPLHVTGRAWFGPVSFSRGSLMKRKGRRAKDTKAIGEFVIAFSQLEFAMRTAFELMMGLTTEQAEIVLASYDFASLESAERLPRPFGGPPSRCSLRCDATLQSPGSRL
nr:hypothetical protein [Bradyrhizobium sp. SRL28]